MRRQWPIPFIHVLLICSNATQSVQAQGIRGRLAVVHYPGNSVSISESASYASGVSTSFPSLSVSRSVNLSALSTSQTSTSGPIFSNLVSSTFASLSSDNGDTVTTTNSVSGISPFSTNIQSSPTEKGSSSTSGSSPASTYNNPEPSIQIYSSLTTTGVSSSASLSKEFANLNGLQHDSDAIAPSSSGSRGPAFISTLPTGLGQSASFSHGTAFVPAFPTDFGPGESGSPSLIWSRPKQPVNTSRVFNGTAFVQSTLNVIPRPLCTGIFGIPCLNPNVTLVLAPGESARFHPVYHAPMWKHPAHELAPAEVPKQTALPDTESSATPEPNASIALQTHHSLVSPATPVSNASPAQDQTVGNFGASPVQSTQPAVEAPKSPDKAATATPNLAPIHGSGPIAIALQPEGSFVTQLAAPIISAAPSSPAVVVGGQTLVNNGPPAIIGGNTVKVSGGSIYVGTSAEPIPQAPILQTTSVPDLIADSLTFTAMSGGPTAKEAPSPVVVGGLTFSAALTDTPGETNAAPGQAIGIPTNVVAASGQPYVAPAQPVATPVEPNAAPIQPNAATPVQPNVQPVVVGGVTYAPIQSADQVAASRAPEASNDGVPSAGTGSSPGQPNTGAGSENVVPGQSKQQPGQNSDNASPQQGQTNAQAGSSNEPSSPQPGQQQNSAPGQIDTKPIVVGGLTYTPVQSNPTSQAAMHAPLNLAGLVGVTAQPAVEPLVQGGVTMMPVQAGAPAPTSVGIVGGQTIYRQGSTAVVGSQTIGQGAAPVFVDNTPVALGPSTIVVGSNTISLPAASLAELNPVGVVGGQTIYRQGSSAVIGSQTIAQGSSPILVDKTPVALGPSAIVIGMNTIPLPPAKAAATTPAVYSFGGVAVTQGGPPVTISGTRYSLGPSFVVEGSKMIPLSSPKPSNPVLTIAGQTITANPTGFSVAGTTVQPDGPAVTYSGTVILLNPSAVVYGSSTIPFPTSTPASSVLTVGSQAFTALPGSYGGGFMIDHSTLLPGSSAAVISGTTYSLNSASSLVIGTSTIPLATSGPNSNGIANNALTAGGETFTPKGNTAVLVNGITLSLSGPPITDHGTVLSLASAGIVVGSSTYAFATPASISALATTTAAVSGSVPLVFTIAGDVFTASPNGGLAIGGTGVFSGSSAVTISGTPISLGASRIVLGSTTVPLASVTGLGPAISGGAGVSPTPAPVATSQARAGSSGAEKGSGTGGIWRRAVMVLVGFMTVLVGCS